MIVNGLRIKDQKDGKCISFTDLLMTLSDPMQLNWSILWLDATPKKGEGSYISELSTKVNHSKDGFPCSYTVLLEVSEKIFQEIEILIVGSKEKANLRRYVEDQEMYETCDIVIEMIDGGFWEVFSMNRNLIDKLSDTYKDIDYLESNFQHKNQH